MGDDLRHPRSRRGRRDRRPDRGHVCRPHRRERAGRADPERAGASLYAPACSPRPCMASRATTTSRRSPAARPTCAACRRAAASRRAALGASPPAGSSCPSRAFPHPAAWPHVTRSRTAFRRPRSRARRPPPGREPPYRRDSRGRGGPAGTEPEKRRRCRGCERQCRASGMSRRRTQFRTALAMSRTEPASVPSAVVHRPSRTVMSDRQTEARRPPPTGGIASVTSIGCPAPRNASLSIAGATCSPSAIIPNHAPGSSSAAAIGPGSRLANGRIALNRCVNPVRPSESAARVCA